MRKLTRAGFHFLYTKGSHYFFHHPLKNRITSVPLHGGKDIGRNLLRKTIKQAGLTIEEFLKL
ncbi:MAG: type II toxin-antitoxin system HicA family toxin [Candidatus Sungbacteria bacterium]|uniref:Type II toxin-antitoxin system HicA family toxin n=1 Tax=Candidatus Sungiibacteriota bacterium TaxID=2750080 RepID=A0A933DT10_9BACT|nr:type II toxin-antitoxin system HicA family toxin [Candidatus Sungbacteria bacterium]